MPKSDIVIVGAGSAGCMLASQIAELGHSSRIRVTLIESPSQEASVANRIRPSHWLQLLGSEDDWNFSTEKTPTLAGRSLSWPRGRGLGGSSRINAMIWFPPTEVDYQLLADSTNTDVATMKATYKKVESLVRPEEPLWFSEAAKRFVAANPENAKYFRRVNRYARRWIPAELLDTDVIQIIRANVDRFEIDNHRVTSVVTDQGVRVACDRAVLSAGTISTPAILMRSGIGPQDVLDDCGIDVKMETPTIGSSLRDHLIMPVVFGVHPEHQFPANHSLQEIEQWQSTGGGPVASNIAEAGGLFNGDQIQFHVTPTHYLTFPSEKAVPAMTMGVNVTQPESYGRIRIRSARVDDLPRIEPNYLDCTSDLEKTIEAVRLARQIAEGSRFNAFLTGELVPGAKRQSDESLAKSIARFAQTLYHPVGTACHLNYAPENLTIADASVLRNITVGNPNATVMTLAYHVAEKIVAELK